MEPYVFTLIINLLLSYIANLSFDKKNRFISLFFILLLIVYNTYFAGLRDFGVGIDTTVYIDSYFDYASSIVNIKEFFDYEGDLGFLGLAYLASKISDRSQSLLIVTALFIFSFYYLAIWRLKKIRNINIFTCNLLFCLIFYCHTLNLMRQFCAIAILTFAFTYFIERKWYIYLLLQIIAYFFHSTSILFIMIPIFWMISQMKNTKRRNLYTIIFIICFVGITFGYFYVLTFLGNIGIVSEIYADRYGQTGVYINNTVSTGTGLGKLLAFVYPLAFIYYAKYKKATSDQENYFVFMMCLISLTLNSLGGIVDFIDRLSFYTYVIYFIFLSNLIASKKLSPFIRMLYVLILIYNWYGVYVIGHGGDIIPYTSKILDII